MDKISYNIEEGLPDLIDHSKKLFGLYNDFFLLLCYVKKIYLHCVLDCIIAHYTKFYHSPHSSLAFV